MLLRLKVWKHWNKKCVNCKLYKFLVLLGIKHSPSFHCNYMTAKHKVEHNESGHYGAAEPSVRCGESHLSGLTEPPQFVY